MDSILKWIAVFTLLLIPCLGLASKNCLVTSDPIFKKQLARDAIYFLDSLGISINNEEEGITTVDNFTRSDLFNRPRSTLIGSKQVEGYLYEAEIVSFSIIKEFKRMFPLVERQAFVYRVEFLSRPNRYSEKCSDTGRRGRRFIERIENILVID